MKRYKDYLLIVATILLSACAEDYANFDNKAFIEDAKRESTVFIKPDTPDITKTFKTSIARPAERKLSISYGVDASLLSSFEEKNKVDVDLLPLENYEIIQAETTILPGNVTSINEFEILFKELAQLNRNQIYVLPIRIQQTDIEVLQTAKTYFYIFKGAALINVVADITENYLTINWQNQDVCNSLDQVTMEALIYPYKFDKMISTVMGIEGQFLIRIGDAGFPSNQIQIATSAGNFPGKDSSKALPTRKWVHIALTFDVKSKEYNIYVNGKKQSSGEFDLKASSINLGNSGFYIGYSFNDERWLDGEIAECRIWNVVRSQGEIANNPYAVDPSSEGLVAYWKFDEGAGADVKDHTQYANHAKAKKAMKWNDVTLPAPSI